MVCWCLLPIWTCGTLWVSRCIHLWDDSPEAGHIQFVSPAFAAETQLIAYIRSNWMEPVVPSFFHVFLFLKLLKYFFTLLISSQSQCQSSKSLSFLFRSSGSLLTTISSAGSLLGSSSQPDQDVSVQGRLMQKFRIRPRKIEELYAKMIKKYQTCAKQIVSAALPNQGSAANGSSNCGGMWDASLPWNTALPMSDVKICQNELIPLEVLLPKNVVKPQEPIPCSVLAWLNESMNWSHFKGVICWCQSSCAHPQMQASTQARVKSKCCETKASGEPKLI